MRVAKLADVAPAIPAERTYGSSDTVWVLGLDRVEADSGNVSFKELKKTADAGPSVQAFDTGNVLYSKLRPYLNKVVLPDEPGLATTELVTLRPDQDLLDRNFLAYYLRSPRFVAWATKKTSGAKMPRVVMKAFWEQEIPLPPLEEQKRIAAILDKADELRTKRKEAIGELDKLQQSVFLNMFGDPITNPKSLPRCSMGEVINFIGGSQPPKDTFVYEPSEGYVRLVQIRDFKSDKYATYIPHELATRPFLKDDVMIARYGPPVFQILTGMEGSYNVALMKAEPREGMEKSFLFHLLNLPSVNRAVVAQSERTAGQSGVNLQFLNNFQVYRVNSDMQQEFSKICSQISLKKELMGLALSSSNELFASLQDRAFKGEL